ncbi:MAG TPA: UDP-N-acetylglucosamine 4,6-dehydratase (inverting) [Deltaproteobacteria bacterium]|nr:UDP-N-acetylglucosamine 4,6-dehydratase (inverting) [Deltaproteobacteria bacterium]
MFNDKVILITGGTGSFGKKFISTVLKNHKPKKLIVFSRDELKQFEMQQVFNEENYPIRYFLGDIRDKDRLYRAFEGVDIIVHAAALKQVPALEYNPFEAVQTNIIGAQNIINAAIDTRVKKLIALSTDKAVGPANLYGATKLCMEKLFISANAYAGTHVTRFSAVRYGNVVGSRGSVIPLFLKQKANGKFTVTDKRMTRFWITLDEGVNLVLNGLKLMKGGEIFIPKIPSAKMLDICAAIGPECKVEIMGIRPGEKLHETLISEDEARHTYDIGKHYMICSPTAPAVSTAARKHPVPEGFVYSSGGNDQWLSVSDIKKIIDAQKINMNV